MKLSELKNKNVGLVLSGGGVKGMAHIGVIQAFAEFGIHPKVVSGASAGALIGALFAQGIPAKEMLNFFKNTPLFRYNLLTLNKPGLIDTERYRGFFKEIFSNDSFEELSKELHVVATDLEKGEAVFFSNGQLIKPLLASAALPPMFSPVEIDGTFYTDGGVMNNFPVEPLQGKCDVMIGSYVSASRETGKEGFRSSFQLTSRANGLLVHASSLHKLDIPDILVMPKDLDLIGVLDKKGIERAYHIGYEYTTQQLLRMSKESSIF